MQEQEISVALSFDRHFIQAGFTLAKQTNVYQIKKIRSASGGTQGLKSKSQEPREQALKCRGILNPGRRTNNPKTAVEIANTRIIIAARGRATIHRIAKPGAAAQYVEWLL
jgi:hypothetical protein